MRKSYPIPDDYNDEWECVSIQWPNSIKWRGILVGLLYSMSRGRSWDERTGKITDVQAIGREIFDRNYPLSACGTNDCGGNGDGDNSSGSVGGYFCWNCSDDDDCEDCEENDMTNCCLSDKIRIENGVLQVMDCGKWVDVGDVGNAIKNSETDASAKEPTGEETEQDFACAKATGYVNVMWNTMNAMFDHHNDLPWELIDAVQKAAKCDLTNTYVLTACLAIDEYAVVGGNMADIIMNNPRQQVICDLAKKLDGSTSVLTDDEWNETFKWLTKDMGGDLVQEGFLTQVVGAINRGNFDRVGRAACANPDFDCTCPDPVEEIPALHDWQFTFDFTKGPYNFTSLFPYADGAGNRWEINRGWVSYPEGDKGFPVQIWARAPYTATPAVPVCQVTYVKIYYSEWGNTDADWDKIWANIYTYSNIHGASLQQQPAHIWQGETGDIADHYLALNGANDWWMGNTGKQFVVSKIVVAGIGEDRFTGCNPDGSLE